MAESGVLTSKAMPSWRRWLQSIPVAGFILLTFSFSWSVWWLAGLFLSGAGSGWRIIIHTIGL